MNKNNLITNGPLCTWFAASQGSISPRPPAGTNGRPARRRGRRRRTRCAGLTGQKPAQARVPEEISKNLFLQIPNLRLPIAKNDT